MLKPCSVAWMVLPAVVALGTGAVSAQSFPIKPIRVLTSSVGAAVILQRG